jgi:DNA-directed RNA polymerase specialized sigma24 family protein
VSLDQPASEDNDGVNVDALFGFEDSPHAKVVESETFEVVRSALAALPERLRLVLECHYIEGLKVHESEAVTGISDTWLVKLRRDGLRRLRKSKAIQSLAA